jgi:hypothetical protein
MRALDAVFAALAGSAFRNRFRLSAPDRAYLQGESLQTMLAHAGRFVAQRLAPAAPRNDGRQTPMRGHPVFTAQHATATCCRKCLARWHGIPAGRPLTDEEQRQVVVAIGRWLAAQGAREGQAPPRPRRCAAAVTSRGDRRSQHRPASQAAQGDLFGLSGRGDDLVP